jgi:hypothetical protein
MLVWKRQEVQEVPPVGGRSSPRQSAAAKSSASSALVGILKDLRKSSGLLRV